MAQSTLDIQTHPDYDDCGERMLNNMYRFPHKTTPRPLRRSEPQTLTQNQTLPGAVVLFALSASRRNVRKLSACGKTGIYLSVARSANIQLVGGVAAYTIASDLCQRTFVNGFA